MDVNTYIDRIEAAVDDALELESIRGEIAHDRSLSEEAKQLLNERIGGYLADGERESGVIPVEADAGA